MLILLPTMAQAQADDASHVLALDIADAVAEAAAPSLGPMTYQPGFSLIVAEEGLQKQMHAFDTYIAQADWAKAFRLLTELEGSQFQAMVPKGKHGRHVLVKEQLQRHLLSLSPAGLHAFRLYFDGQAAEQLEQVKSHPLAGSEDQLLQAQALVGRLLASSVGVEAAVLLGDIYFERGMFDRAARAWQLALDQGSATGQTALTLQAKRILAVKRSGRTAEAQQQLNAIAGRYQQVMIQAGGETIDALQWLGQDLGRVSADQTAADHHKQRDDLLPKPQAMPAWHLRFIDQANQDAINQSLRENRYYSPPADILKFIPPVAADDQRVYFHWLGVVFALDQETGKLVWQNGSIKTTAQTLADRIQTNQGDPRNYRIALGDGVLIASQTTLQRNNGPFILKAYEAHSGQLLWSSDTREDWHLNESEPTASSTPLGEMLIHEGRGYAVVGKIGQNALSLRRFDLKSGKIDWTLPLGDAEAISFQYTNVNRLPQPTLLIDGSLLYILTNNGALLAVDVVGNEIKWALQMTPPWGIGHNHDNANAFRGNRFADTINTLANPNGSGQLLLHQGTLYAKEHNGKALYAMDARTGEVHWQASQLKPDAKLIGVDGQRFYLMDRALHCYEIAGEHDLITKNGNDTNRPDHAKPIVTDTHILTYANGKLRRFDKTRLDPAGRYDKADYLGSKGGHLYRVNDLLIAIDTTQITAFKTPFDIPSPFPEITR